MRLDTDAGVISFTPSPVSFDRNFGVKADVIDGVLSDEITFNLDVVENAPLITTVVDDIIIFNNPAGFGNSMDGIGFRYTDGLPGLPYYAIRIKGDEVMPALDPSITLITEVIFSEISSHGQVDILVPADRLNDPHVLFLTKVYTYFERHGWSPSSLDEHVICTHR